MTRHSYLCKLDGVCTDKCVDEVVPAIGVGDRFTWDERDGREGICTVTRVAPNFIRWTREAPLWGGIDSLAYFAEHSRPVAGVA